MSRRAFTLFEVAIALALTGTAVVVALALFPSGVRAQQVARFRLYAAAKAMEITERFVCANVGNPAVDHEATAPWDLGFGYRAQSPDLECKISGHRFGMHPMPRTISTRLDSDGDEIQRLLDEGGELYYFAPTGGGSWREDTLPLAPPDDGQRVVVGVAGYAQNNAVPLFPLKAWPYQVPYPSPPTHVIHGTGGASPAVPGAPVTLTGRCEFWPSQPAGLYAWNGTVGVDYLWDSVSDPADPDLAQVLKVFAWHEPTDGLDYGYKPFSENATPATAVRYLQAAIWWCAKLDATHGAGATAAFLTPANPALPIDDFTRSSLPPRTQVLALRYLAHAALSLTSYFPYAGDLQSGHVVPPVTLDGQATPQLTVTHDLIRFWHSSCLNLVNRFAATYPYDWGAPRPLERAIMMDWPLLECDLCAAPITGTITGTGVAGIPAVQAEQWRLLRPQKIVNLGRSMSYPGFDLDGATYAVAGGGTSGIWSEPDPATATGTSHFSLCAPFEASERCRQLVFWAVDWQSYVDFETAPSAPVDASKFPKFAPIQENGAVWDFTRMMSASGAGPGWCPDTWVDHHLHTWRNPEKALIYLHDMSRVPTGADVSADTLANGGVWERFAFDEGASTVDPGPVRIFNGLYGADRNFNHRLDRGSVPVSARLRAVTLGRWNFYDPRVPEQFR